ncbi:MAG TPA: preprotein translocase subunit SecY [Anaerolineaceae bacterium]|jgi:preprotein translocase subunit SecY|nr:preprotein translocase subunit SecY [Anaerolineaceae bacterium]
MKRSAWRYLWKSEDIRKKILITLLLLAIFRLAANIPVPGINTDVIRSVFDQTGATGTLLDLLDLLAGGTMSSFSILAMGVYPYITAQIILQLLMPIIPALERKIKENPREGRQLMERWTIIGTIPMALLSAIGQINIFNSMAMTNNVSIFTIDYGWNLATIAVVSTMVAGTLFGVWIGQLISEFGIPNQGLSLVIFAGIVANIPGNLISLILDKQYWWLIFVVVAVLVLTIFAIVYVTQGRRNVPVMFPGRRMGARMSMPVKSSLPLMVTMAGMIPLIFAQSLLTFPAIIASFLYNVKTPWLAQVARDVYNLFSGQGVVYAVLYFLMVVAFTFFYTDVLFTQQNYGDNLKKQGARIMGVVPGEPTQRYLTKVQRRITLPGALFLGTIAVLPYILNAILPEAARQAGLFLISAAGLLIVVGVVRDTFTIIETELKLHGYDESLIRG